MTKLFLILALQTITADRLNRIQLRNVLDSLQQSDANEKYPSSSSKSKRTGSYNFGNRNRDHRYKNEYFDDPSSYLKGPPGRQGIRGIPGASCDYKKVEELIEAKLKNGKSVKGGNPKISNQMIDFHISPGYETVDKRDSKNLRFTTWQNLGNSNGKTAYSYSYYNRLLISNDLSNTEKSTKGSGGTIFTSTEDNLIINLSLNLIFNIRRPYVPNSYDRLRSWQRIELSIKKYNQFGQLYDNQQLENRKSKSNFITQGSKIVQDLASNTKINSLSMNSILRLNKNDYFTIEVNNDSKRKVMGLEGDLQLLLVG